VIPPPSTGFGSGFDFSVDFPKEEIDEQVISGEKLLIVQGCLVYESLGATRHSAFCYFFKDNSTALEHLNICSAGSNAD